MVIVRVGARTVNLRYMIFSEELTDPPGVLRLVLESGMAQDFHGPDADKIRHRLDALDHTEGPGSRGEPGTPAILTTKAYFVGDPPPPQSAEPQHGSG